MQVKLKATKLVDEIDERVIQFRIVCAETSKELYSTKSTEKRNGLRSWDQSGIYAARRRIRAWVAKHSATLV